MWSADPSVWQDALSSHPTAVSELAGAKSKPNLPELEAFFQTDLPSLIASRTPRHITQPEYVRLISWKLTRGKWRPRLQAYAKETSASEIRETSTKAFRQLDSGDVLAALKTLVSIRGCGPATASALLAAADDSVPFMSDELLLAAQGSRTYTVSAYRTLLEDVREKAVALSGDSNWTARDVEKAVFAAAHSDVCLDGSSKKRGGTGKRTAVDIGQKDRPTSKRVRKETGGDKGSKSRREVQPAAPDASPTDSAPLRRSRRLRGLAN